MHDLETLKTLNKEAMRAARKQCRQDLGARLLRALIESGGQLSEIEKLASPAYARVRKHMFEKIREAQRKESEHGR